MLNGAGALVNNAQEARGWFDTANPDIANRGFFFAVEGAAQSFAGGGSVDVLFGVEARSLRVYNRHDKTRSFTGSTGAHGSTLRRHNAHALQGVRMRRQ